MTTKKLCVLGSTGSIGVQALSLTEALGIEIAALSAHSNIRLLEEQARRFSPDAVSVTDEASARELRLSLADTRIKVLPGAAGALEIAASPGSDTVLNAIVGAAGLAPTLAAASAGKKIALANKESLVAGGGLVMAAVENGGAELLPVDSEHSAIFQCLQASPGQSPRRILLTASGGPFFGRTKAELREVSVEDALRHPNWSMGKKITVDSATLMNKGLELIEAMWLFGLSPEQIEVVVHRQSIVHSMVEFGDGSVIAQLGPPDMRIPIQYALTYPERRPSPAEPLSVAGMHTLTFESADSETFTCLAAATRAARIGGTAPAALNAANERAVEAFLRGDIPFTMIGDIASFAVSGYCYGEASSLDDILAADAGARRTADRQIANWRKDNR